MRAALLALTSTLAAGAALAVEIKDVASTYQLAAIYDELKDGTKNDTWGKGVDGMLVLTADGHFISMIVSADRNKEASKSPRTPVGPVIAYYGTYKVDGKTITYHLEKSTFPGWDGIDRKGEASATTLALVQPVVGDEKMGPFNAHATWTRVK